MTEEPFMGLSGKSRNAKLGTASSLTVKTGLLSTGLFLFALVQMRLYRGYFIDDVYISFRYAKNLFLGNGLTWNTGETPVEGYSNFLWVVVNVIPYKFGIDPVRFARYLGILSLMGTGLLLLVFTPTILKKTSSRVLAATWVLLCPAICFYAQSGMETLFFSLLVTAGALCYGRSFDQPSVRYKALAGLLLGLSSLTRPEGLGVLGLAVLFECYLKFRGGKRSQGLAPLLTAGLSIWLPHFLWRLSYYGYPLPNTYYAKYAGGGLEGTLHGLVYFGASVQAYLAVPATLILFKLTATRGLKKLDTPEKKWLGWLAFLLVGYYTYTALIGGDDVSTFPSYRLMVPLLPVLYLTLAGCLERLDRNWIFAAVGTTAMLAFCSFPDFFDLVKRSTGATNRFGMIDLIHEVTGDKKVGIGYREYADWIEKNSCETSLIAVPWAGVVPYFTNRPTLDTLGLNDRYLAHLPRRQRGLDVKMNASYVLSRKPDLIFINVHRGVVLGSMTFEQAGGWKQGDRDLLEALRTDPAYELRPDAAGTAVVYARRDRCKPATLH